MSQADADGLGQHKEWGATDHRVSLGTALLLMMHLSNRIITTQPPASIGNGGPQLIRLQACSKPSPSGHVRHQTELPMTIDVSCERSYPLSELTHEQAQEHGFTSPDALRRELGIKRGTDCTLYSYPVTHAPKEELATNPDKYGTIMNNIRAALYDAMSNGKNGKKSKRSTHPFADGNREPSIQRALDYFNTLPVTAQREGFHYIAPTRELDEATRMQWLTRAGKKLLSSRDDISINDLASHFIPTELRVSCQQEGNDRFDHAPRKRNRRDRGEIQKLTEGEGWKLIVAQGPRAETNHQPAANNNVEQPALQRDSKLEEKWARKARSQTRKDLAAADQEWGKRRMRDGLKEVGESDRFSR